MRERFQIESMKAVLAGISVLVFAGATQAAPPITAAVFSPDGKSVLVGSQAGIKILAYPSLGLQRKIATQLAHVHDLVFSPDGKRFAAGGGSPAETGEVELFSWPKCESIKLHRWHDDLVYRLAWRGRPNLLAVASGDRSVVLFSGQQQRLKGHSRPVTSVGFLPGGDYLVSAGWDNSLRLWDLKTGKLRRTMDNHTGPVHDLAVRPVREGLPLVATASADRTVRFWQPTIGRMVRFARFPAEPLAIDWTPNGQRLLAACADNLVRVIDPQTVKVTARIPTVVSRPITVLATPDGRNIIVGGSDGKVNRIPLHPPDP